MSLGVLGGTFDPVHYGHLLLAEQAREQLDLERVLFVPAGQPWRKAGREISPGGDRLAMLRLAVEDNPVFEVAGLELERSGPSFTVITLEELQKQHPGTPLYLILGEDALADLPNWREPKRILELAIPAVARRDSGVAEGACMEASREILGNTVVHLKMPLVGISGSDIRARVREGRSVRYMLPVAVEAFVRDRRLYVEQAARAS